MVGMSASMAEASYGAMFNRLNLHHLQQHRLFVVDPHQKMIMSVHFERTVRRTYQLQMSNVAIKFSQVLKKSIEQSVSKGICAN